MKTKDLNAIKVIATDVMALTPLQYNETEAPETTIIVNKGFESVSIIQADDEIVIPNSAIKDLCKILKK